LILSVPWAKVGFQTKKDITIDHYFKPQTYDAPLFFAKIEAMTRSRYYLILSTLLVNLAMAPVVAAQTSGTTSPSIPQPAKPLPTLESLQSQIRQRMSVPNVTHGRVGIRIMSLNSGKVVLDHDGDKYFIPASNMKNFTVAAALEKLGPDFKFVTSVYAAAKPGADGTIKGDLHIYGRGDVTMSTLFATRPANDPEIYYERLDRLADTIVSAGVRRIEGGLVADEGYFTGSAVPLTWELEDIQWDDGAEVSAFPINNNSVDLVVRGGRRAGEPCDVTILPRNSLYQLANLCSTSGSSRSISVKKSLEKNFVAVSGTMPAGQSWTGYITFTHPADLFIAMLRERLEKKGVTVTGGVRTIVTNRNAAPTTTPPFSVVPVEIARLESPPFRDIAAKTMKPSQNMFTETILWTLGEEIGRKAGRKGDSADLGLDVVENFLRSTGITSDGVVQFDGSGMSRRDLVTPNAIVALYTYMAKQSRNAQAWRDSLTVGGVDGTLRNRFKGTLAAGNIRGKTGTLDQVSALSGYVTTAGGEPVVVSIIVNGVPSQPDRTSLIDDIVVAVAAFKGKID
jgi:D-alanyl-D-alanine carboxypeptidase/D-alanyl-D-alanine-endopeptidase (penicillin-binding protein 4)